MCSDEGGKTNRYRDSTKPNCSADCLAVVEHSIEVGLQISNYTFIHLCSRAIQYSIQSHMM